MPAFAGSLHWDDHAVALVQEYVPGTDGWAWCAAAARAGDVADIARLGAESARLHAALAAYGSTPAHAADLHAWRGGGRGAARARDRLRARRGGRRAAQRCGRASWPSSRRSSRRPRPVALQRLHGDYHVGQVLRTAGGPAGRRRPRGRADQARRRALAAGAGAARRGRDAALVRPPRPGTSSATCGPATAPRSRRWIDRARAAFLDAYGPVDERAAARARGREGVLRVHLCRRVPARVDVCACGRDALADGARWLTCTPSSSPPTSWTARACSRRRPWSPSRPRALVRRARRVLFLGMGSSRYAALDAATLLRSHGYDAYAELASTGSPQPPAADTLVGCDLGHAADRPRRSRRCAGTWARAWSSA